VYICESRPRKPTFVDGPLLKIGLLLAFHCVALTSTVVAASPAVNVVAWGPNLDGLTNVPPQLTNAVAIAAGVNHCLAVKADGTVVAWGNNGYGQTDVPPDLSNVTAVAGGFAHSLALSSNGTVVAWGQNTKGQTDVPAGLSNVVAIAAGDSHSLALKSDGLVAAWGNNYYGQGTVPAGVSNVVAIASRGNQNLVLMPDGIARGWGNAPGGGTSVPSTLSNVVAIAPSSAVSLALKDDGRIVMWMGSSTVPARLSNAVAIAAGETRGMALQANGIVVSWNLAVGAEDTIPATVTNAEAIACGSLHSLVMLGDGRPVLKSGPVNHVGYRGESVRFCVMAAGAVPLNYQWQFQGTNLPAATNALLILTGVRQEEAGRYSVTVSNAVGWVRSSEATLAVVDRPPLITSQPVSRTTFPGGPATFQVSCEGALPMFFQWRREGEPIVEATNSQLLLRGVSSDQTGIYSVAVSNASGTVLSSNCQLSLVPVAAWGQDVYGQIDVPASLTNVVSAAGGLRFTAALRADGTVVTWDNTGVAPDPWNVPDVVQMAAGSEHVLALRSDGTVAAWGSNLSGQTNVPTGLKNVVSIAAGYLHNLAVKADGGVVAWGWNQYGQTDMPASLVSVIAVAGGYCHSLALKSDGTVAGWGQSSFGQLTPPEDLTNALAISAGGEFSMALRRDGTVAVWGDGSYGQTNLPAGLTNVVAIAAGFRHCLALKQDRTVVAWGATGSSYDFGQATVPDGLTNAISISVGGFHSLAVCHDRPLFILQQPRHQTNYLGTGASFSVKAVSAPPVTCQWQHNGTNLPGETNLSLNLARLQISDGGTYGVALSNCFGTLFSASATLTVLPDPEPGPAEWVAFFDYARGATAARVLAFESNTGSGYLTNRVTGAALPVFLTMSTVGSPSGGNSVEGLVAGTPAYTMFNGYCDLSGYCPAYMNADGQSCSITLSNLNPLARYKLAGTVNRNYSAYTNRITLVELLGANACRAGHTAGVITNGLGVNQAGLVCYNQAGEFVAWEDVDPGSDGVIVLRSSRFTNQTAHALGALRLEEFSIPVTILSQPQDVPACPGSEVAFAATVAGTLPIDYQWYSILDGLTNEVPQGTNSTLSLRDVTQPRGYFVIVGNSVNSVTSAVARVDVDSRPVQITAEPQDEAVAFGGTVSFRTEVALTSSRPTATQWYQNSVSNSLDLSTPVTNGVTTAVGSTNFSLTLTNIVAGQAGYYFAVLTNCNGQNTSRVASLAVYYTGVQITNQPLDSTNYLNGTIALTVGATGFQPLFYQWYKDEAPVLNATNQSFVLQGLQFSDVGDYYVVVTNLAPSRASSRIATVAVSPRSPFTLLSLSSVSPPSQWRFNQGGTNLGTEWMAPGYADTGWSAGRGIFGLALENPVISPQIRTPLNLLSADGANQTLTYYFRTTINLTYNPQWMLITTSNVFDDGMVVYLNGREAYRFNMPEGQITCRTLASTAAEGFVPQNRPPGSWYWSTNLPTSGLVPGMNSLAVEVHQAAAYTNRDVFMGLRADATFPAWGKPKLLSQPQSQSHMEGMPATLAVDVAGWPLSCQWFKQTDPGEPPLPVSGAVDKVLVFPNAVSGREDGFYFVVVSNMFRQVTSEVASLVVTQAPPLIVRQPLSQVVCRGEPAIFSVAHIGSISNFLQWRLNDVDIPGATNAEHLVPAAADGDAGVYTVFLSNNLGSTTSEGALLRVTAQYPVILVQPVTQLMGTGATARFTVAAEGCPPLLCQWQFNGSNIVGATSPTLLLTNVQFAQAGAYRVIVTNSFGVALSSNASLFLPTLGEVLNCTNLSWTNGPLWTLNASWSSVEPIGSLITWLEINNPQCQWYVEEDVTHDGVAAIRSGADSAYYASCLSTAVTGPGKLSFWWRMQPAGGRAAIVLMVDDDMMSIHRGGSGLLLSGGTNWQQQQLYVPPGTHSLEWRFTANGSTNSPVAWLDEVTYTTNDLQPTIIASPASSTVSVGSETRLGVVAEGYPTLRYQWQFNGVNLPDATQTNLTVAPVRTSDAGAYAVVVANDFGAVTSAVAVLAVNDTTPWFRPQRLQVLGVPGGDAAIQAAAFGSEPLFYQWTFEGIPLAGETNATLWRRQLGSHDAGRYSVAVTNAFGGALGPNITLILSRVSYVVHISSDGLAAKHLATGLKTAPERYPNFARLLNEGSSTLNARCDYDISYTVPNHLSMLTGRPALQPAGQPDTVHHGYTPNDTPTTTNTVHNTGNPNVPYKASVFDVVHDRGLRTAFLVGKFSLAVCAQSYDGTNGAPDLIPPDDGSNKIDVVLYPGDAPQVVDAWLLSLTNGMPYHYAFLHFVDLDNYGHFSGWGSEVWFDHLQQIDTQLGRILSAIEANSSLNVALETAVILTADHGGSGRSHGNPQFEPNYTIPLLVWGPGFPAGADLYTMFANRADPGTNHFDYNAVWQPLRNGDSGNLALAMLGLPPIPGSTLIPLFPTSTPSLAIRQGVPGPSVEWSAAAAQFILEASDSLSPDAIWVPVTEGIVTNSLSLSYGIPREAGSRFCRLKKYPVFP
jgi:alpha-tubulin suppressor-like RCC1 family protein